MIYVANVIASEGADRLDYYAPGTLLGPEQNVLVQYGDRDGYCVAANAADEDAALAAVTEAIPYGHVDDLQVASEPNAPLVPEHLRREDQTMSKVQLELEESDLRRMVEATEAVVIDGAPREYRGPAERFVEAANDALPPADLEYHVAVEGGFVLETDDRIEALTRAEEIRRSDDAISVVTVVISVKDPA